MKDMVPKGTGNSRFLRSSIAADITHEELVALLRSGKFPVDFAGLNSVGIQVQGSAYNKANVLPDNLCSILGIATNSEPKDAFNALQSKLNAVNARFVIGTYIGNGTKSVNTQEIHLGFKPDFVAVYANEAYINRPILFCTRFLDVVDNRAIADSGTGIKSAMKITDYGFYVSDTESYRFTDNSRKYGYFAVRSV
nr:hypothetical protein [uncultured Butyricicoccus sp.]